MSVRRSEGARLLAEWPEALAVASMALARRCADGATIWCWSPRWPQHAEHVAVEFVHPVIVGTRALPAEVVDGPEPLQVLRTVVRAGDVLVLVGEASTTELGDVSRRAPAWGVETIWIGCGPPPPAGAADHLVWLDAVSGPAAAAAFDGRLVLSYHVLWELTHVCFEHPGLLAESADDDACATDVHGHCVTCADEGILGEVAAVVGSAAVVRTPAGLVDIDATLVEPVESGDLVLVHAGVAISRLGGSAS
ncbi:MAG: HypC/HybG/HupF family hydrogenase formation chaperone [Acidimicrobiales bacterium]